jgi:DNA polymerase-3 subunit beta
MEPRLTIGEFARQGGLSRSALRFYDQNGLLRPRWVDDETAYRFYAPSQLDDARLIRRLRAAELPVVLLREYLGAGPERRSEILEHHDRAFRERAEGVQATVAELRAELGAGPTPGPRWAAIAAGAFAEALAQISFAIADVADRPELAVVWLETRDESLRLVATDSFRLAVRDLVPDALGSAPVRAAIAARNLDGLGAELRSGGALTLRQGPDDGLVAVLGGRSIPIGGPGTGFPDYERILSELPAGREAVLARRDLKRALADLPATEGRVALRFSAAGLALQAGTRVARAGGDWPGSELVVWLDRVFLADAVAATVGPDVTIEAIGPFQPVTLRSADTGTFSVLTMPIRP